MKKIAEAFDTCRDVLQAIGDENRQYLIAALLKAGKGMRVLELAEETHLSRPAVARHIRVLQDAGLVKYYKQGTKGYYTFEPDQESMALLYDLAHLFKEALPAAKYGYRPGTSSTYAQIH